MSALPAAELPAADGDTAAGAAATHAARFAPPGLLDRLLRLSSDLAAEHEVTPTQAWQYLRAQPRFADLELARVYAFARQLRDIIKCRGYVWSPHPCVPFPFLLPIKLICDFSLCGCHGPKNWWDVANRLIGLAAYSKSASSVVPCSSLLVWGS